MTGVVTVMRRQVVSWGVSLWYSMVSPFLATNIISETVRWWLIFSVDDSSSWDWSEAGFIFSSLCFRWYSNGMNYFNCGLRYGLSCIGAYCISNLSRCQEKVSFENVERLVAKYLLLQLLFEMNHDVVYTFTRQSQHVFSSPSSSVSGVRRKGWIFLR